MVVWEAGVAVGLDHDCIVRDFLDSLLELFGFKNALSQWHVHGRDRAVSAGRGQSRLADEPELGLLIDQPFEHLDGVVAFGAQAFAERKTLDMGWEAPVLRRQVLLKQACGRRQNAIGGVGYDEIRVCETNCDIIRIMSAVIAPFVSYSLNKA